MHDLVIQGGRIVDGTGAPAFAGDVAVSAGVITQVGAVSGPARRTLDADGLIVTPGFVDIHTHYDAQVTWDPHLSPSNSHGVTTAVFGNCGVGFAPCAPDRHQFLIELMEGVEDIPGAAIEQGIQWSWESFPEYLDALERSDVAMDVGTHIAHGPVRAYVMGERGARNEPASPQDIERMAAIVKEAVSAGALGFSTSRTIVHRALNGEPVPGTFAAADELFGIGRVLAELGQGVFEVAQAGAAGESMDGEGSIHRELAWMRELATDAGVPVSFAVLQTAGEPDLWREQLAVAAEAAEDGAQMFAQVSGRPAGVLIGLEGEYHPFVQRPSYKAIAQLPIAERVDRMRDPACKSRILSESPEVELPTARMGADLSRLFPIGNPPNYEPLPEDSVAARAARQGREPMEFLYDLMLAEGGRSLFLVPAANFAHHDCDVIREMLDHPRSVISLADGGAHCGFIADASAPTFMLTHWVRDRTRGPRLALEKVIAHMTTGTANVYGLRDRGAVAPGLKADLNLIDFDRLALHPPQMLHDLPGGGRRLFQGAEGYAATVVNGEITMEWDKPTGALPGRLIRGAQPDPRRGGGR